MSQKYKLSEIISDTISRMLISQTNWLVKLHPLCEPIVRHLINFGKGRTGLFSERQRKGVVYRKRTENVADVA